MKKDNNVTPVISEPYSISLSASKYILSKHDNDTCVLSATVTDENNNPCNNQTVTFKSDNTVLDTAITDNNGIATYTYNSQGNNEFYASASINNLNSNDLLIEDLLYYNDGTKTTGISFPSGTTVTTENGMLKINCTTSGEKNIYYPISFTNASNFIAEFEIAKIGVVQSIALYLKNSTTAGGCWFAYNDVERKWSGGTDSTWNIENATLSVGDIIKIKQQNKIITMYQNDTQLYSKSRSLAGTYYVGHYTNNGRTQYVKNIKVKKI